MKWLALIALVAAAPAAAIDEHAIRFHLERELAGIAGRVEVSIGEVDPRLQLAPCARMEPFVPAGARLWGRTRMGVRCMEGANWVTYVPIEVRVHGPALVAARSLPAGKLLAPEDWQVAEVELTRERPGVLTEAADTRDRILVRPVGAGQPLRADQLRAAPAVSAGDLVRVTYSGTGFSVSAEGKALSSAGVGQTVRVQTGAGRILTGVAKPGRIVDVNP